MIPVVLPLPEQLHENLVFPFLNNLWNVKDKEVVQLDHSSLSYSFPFGMLVYAYGVRDFVKYRKQKKLQTVAVNIKNDQVHSYLGHIGFFKFMGLQKGLEPGEASGNDRYLPISIVTKRNLLANTEDSPDILHKAIEKESERLTKIILSLPSPAITHPITYCLREIIRNVFEHAQTLTCIVCAQKWTEKTIEIAIADNGIGVLESLNQRYKYNNDIDALRQAIRPGISRVDVSKITTNNNPWSNSGFGLYVLSELCKKTGEFLICSGKSGIYLCNDEQETKPFPFAGTAVKLRMVRPKGQDVQQLIREIVTEGERIARESGTGVVRASKSTKTFSNFDF
jgi:hypothetical protein